ncbi:hypothetical protein SAMN02799630_00361 [Paenibacillus sp. UNCCL117]|nr:hypothetical protein SAMN04488602_102170 [Paenibacillus sp. cl123]SFW13159.1 hypothetical protein SAMN02799630_00361 [Paenibacillus sp. UNCCL117]
MTGFNIYCRQDIRLTAQLVNPCKGVGDVEDWKQKIGERALQKGIIKDPYLLDRLDEPMPVWAVLEMMLELLERQEPPYSSYD